jgi:hypothetical protein
VVVVAAGLVVVVVVPELPVVRPAVGAVALGAEPGPPVVLVLELAPELAASLVEAVAVRLVVVAVPVPVVLVVVVVVLVVVVVGPVGGGSPRVAGLMGSSGQVIPSSVDKLAKASVQG